MPNKQTFDIQQVDNLLAPPEGSITLMPLTAIKESDHAFFWGAFFLSIATCLFGCAASLYASAYDHPPFIILLAGFGLLYLIFFIAFTARGLQIRKQAQARESMKRASDVVYPRAADRSGARVDAGRIQEGIVRALGDGVARTREEVIGVLSGLSTEEVDVGTLHQVLQALVEAGAFTETESGGRTMLTFNREPALA